MSIWCLRLLIAPSLAIDIDSDDSGDSSDSSDSGTDASSEAAESRVADTAGEGATSGLPTASDSGAITMTYRQVSPLPSHVCLQELTTQNR